MFKKSWFRVLRAAGRMFQKQNDLAALIKGKTPWNLDELARRRSQIQQIAQQQEEQKRQEQQKNAPKLPADPKVQQAIGILKGLPLDQLFSHIADAVRKGTLTEDRGDQLYSYYKVLPPPSPAGAKEIKNAVKGLGGMITGEIPVPGALIP